MEQAIFTSTTFQKRFVNSLQIFGGSLFIALCAQISIPLPFTPVPITAQTLAVLLLGTALGRKNGMLSVIAYLCEVSLGLPVLAGGVMAPLALLGPRSGYLIGMIFQAYLAGLFSEWKLSRGNLFLGLLVSCVIQLSLGAYVLGHFVGWSNAIPMGMLPFIPGEILKSFIVVRTIRSR